MKPYESLSVYCENRLPPRAYYIPENSYTSLNGDWRFRYFKNEELIPTVIDCWDTIPVPSCWQLFGYENPNYTNILYPYPVDPPFVPDDNPVGVYEKDFLINSTENLTYIVLEGVSSCAYVVVNGKYVGFTRGSHLQAEFDLSPFVKKGENTLRIYVLKWCAESYLEDQDFFRYSGIFRDIYLLSRPKGHIKDFFVHTTENSLTVDIDTPATLRVLDGDKCIGEMSGENNISFTFDSLTLWNAENPYLYTLEIECAGEIIRKKIGFRTVTITNDHVLCVNGKPIHVHGVNHHDTHPENGWCMTDEEIKKDLLLMKELNINAIRTSHYPPSPVLVELADEMGFYVMLETDIETHGFVSRLPKASGYDMENPDFLWPCRDPEWKEIYISRMERAIERDKNAPSIIIWSTGNEGGFGENQIAMIEFAHQRDPERYVHCEDACRRGIEFAPYSDVYSRMYPSAADVEGYAKDENIKTPILLCEYAHAMGNSPGGLCDYEDFFDRYDNIAGGYIWEWTDHTVIVDGVQKYGGDFENELTHDYNFCCDGLTFSDRSFKAGSLEAKTAFQPMKTKLGGNLLTVKNRYDFTDFKEHTLLLTLQADGKTLRTKTLSIPLAPAQSKDIPLDFTLPAASNLGVFLKIELIRPDGKTVAMCQHEMDVPRIEKRPASPLATLTEDAYGIFASGENFSYRFSKRKGNFDSIMLGGVEQLKAPVSLTAFHAPTDNEGRIMFKLWSNFGGQRGAENLNHPFTKVYDCKIENGRILVNASFGGVSKIPAIRFDLAVDIYADGRIDFCFDGKVRPDCVWLPRLGFEFFLPESMNEFSYFGYGPSETYRDSYLHEAADLYNSTAEKEYVPYVFPQEHGNHFGVRYLKVGSGMVFTSENDFECNVTRYTAQTLEKAKHTDEITPEDGVIVRVDYKHSGIGSHSCGPELPVKYRVDEKDIHFTFTLTPETK